MPMAGMVPTSIVKFWVVAKPRLSVAVIAKLNWPAVGGVPGNQRTLRFIEY